MNRLLTLFFGLSVLAEAEGQPYWVRKVSSFGNEHVADVATDADGAIYVVGEYGGTMQFGGQTVPSNGGIDFFVARLDANGGLVWLKHGGGAGIDRGMKVALGSGDQLVVTGEFMGAADVLGVPLTSAGGTADMFVARLSKADGSLVWLKQGGGPAGVDRPNGVSVAADGRVCVAGEFRGAAQWDGNTLVSMTDPGTGQPSADVFVASYAANGSLEWLKHGAARYTDYAVEVVHDAAGAAYVAGQFSDTLTFDAVHNSTLMNASFLVRFDAQGNETWFRRFGGATFNHVRDLVRAPDGRLILTGDVQGTMLWFGAGTVNVPGGAPYAYYLLAVDGTGQLLGQSTMGSQNGVSVSGLAVSASSLAVLGKFNCQFTGLSNQYQADGLFMATGPEDLFVALHAPATLVIASAQQFGGRASKLPGGIALVGGSVPVFTGSYQHSLIFPATGGFTGDAGTTAGTLVGNNAGSYCGDAGYGNYIAVNSAGLTDGFVARGYVTGRQPYDWWRREGTGCDRSRLVPCIRSGVSAICPDTITSCGSVSLNVNTRYAYSTSANANYLGPPLQYLWSTGSTASSILASSTGTYSVTITTANGCWSWTDAIHVVVNALPPIPLISDDVVVNSTTPGPQPIYLCDPEAHWAWASNLGSAEEFHWTTPLGQLTSNDSVRVDTGGVYIISVTGANGCSRSVGLQVFDTVAAPMPDLDLQASIIFAQDEDANDSLMICPGAGVIYTYVPTWIVNGVASDTLPPGLDVAWREMPLPPYMPIDDGAQDDGLVISEPGWHYVWRMIRVTNGRCGGDTVYFEVRDSIYVDFFQAQSLAVSLTGPSVVCDGDTIQLIGSCTGCSSTAWSGSPGVQGPGGSLLVSAPGQYTFTGSATDGNGCDLGQAQSITVTMPTGPVLSISPNDGIVCPGASAVISTVQNGTDHVWYGPQGPILGAGPSLTTDAAGQYYLAMVIGGCPVVSNSVVVTAYGTPYLNIQPSAVLCHPGQQVSIQVMASPGAAVQWTSPSGFTGLMLSTAAPGVYACNVSSCGIITPLAVEVIAAPANAGLLTPGPFTLCGGDSLVLAAAPGADSYAWLPMGATGDSLIVSSGGDFALAVTNAAGCSDTSAVVHVDYIDFPIELIAAGDTVCAGQQALLLATGSGGFAWYADAALGQLLGTGPQWSAAPSQSASYWVRQEEQGCFGDTVAAFVVVNATPSPIGIDGPTFLCAGDALHLVADAPDTVLVNWSTPWGGSTGPRIDVAAAGIAQAGTYSAQASYRGCSSPVATHALQVHDPAPLELPPYTSFCEGASVTFNVPSGFTGVQWSTGAVGSSITLIASAVITVRALDPAGCPVKADLEVEAVDCPLFIPNVFSPNGDERNDTWLISGGFISAPITIYNRWGDVVYEGDMLKRGWDGRHYRNGEPCSEGVYYYVLQLNRADAGIKHHAGYVHLYQ